MLGKVVGISKLTNYTDELLIEDISDKSMIRIPVSSYSEIKVGDTVSVHIEITKIINSNFNHEYPEGTLKSPRM